MSFEILSDSPPPPISVRSAPGNHSDWAQRLRSPWLLGTLLLAGVALRCIQFFYNRSVYVDEAALALNLRNRSLAELLSTPLDFAQTAPVAYLLQQKLMLMAFGEHEYVLRLVPFLAGLLSIPLFLVLARRVLSGIALTITVALFALSYSLIYFAADLKPYSVDLFAAVVLLLMGSQLVEHGITWRRTALLAVVGAVLVWFSQPALIVLGGVWITLLWTVHQTKNTPAIRPLLGLTPVWAFSAAASMLLALRTLSPDQRTYMHDYWIWGFLPLLPKSLHDIVWLPLTAIRLSADPLGAFVFPGLMALVFIVGAFQLRRVRAPHALLIASPVILTLLASALGQYPFHGRWGLFAGRVIIFLAPCLFLIAGVGVQAFARTRLVRPRFAIAILIALLAVNLWPLARSFPADRNEMRPVLEYVAKHRHPSDHTYVFYGARHVYEWYAPRVGLRDARPIYGVCARTTPERYVDDFRRIPRRARVWIIFSRSVSNERSLTLAYFDLNGRRIDHIVTVGAFAALYEMRNDNIVAVPTDPLLFAVQPFADLRAAHPKGKEFQCRGLHEWPNAYGS